MIVIFLYQQYHYCYYLYFSLPFYNVQFLVMFGQELVFKLFEQLRFPLTNRFDLIGKQYKRTIFVYFSFSFLYVLVQWPPSIFCRPVLHYCMASFNYGTNGKNFLIIQSNCLITEAHIGCFCHCGFCLFCCSE